MTQTVRVPEDLWNRAKLVMARWPGATGERLTMQSLISEGLDIKVSQLEKKLEAKAGAA